MEATIQNTQQQTGDTIQVVLFKLGEEKYGLPIDYIKEVVPTPKLVKVPLSPSYIVGIANIRGDILSIVDLETRFEIKPTEAANKSYTLVLDHDKLKMGILVSEVPQTLNIDPGEIDRSSPVLQSNSGENFFIEGIIKSDDTLVFLIDVLKIMDDHDLKSFDH